MVITEQTTKLERRHSTSGQSVVAMVGGGWVVGGGWGDLSKTEVGTSVKFLGIYNYRHVVI